MLRRQWASAAHMAKLEARHRAASRSHSTGAHTSADASEEENRCSLHLLFHTRAPSNTVQYYSGTRNPCSRAQLLTKQVPTQEQCLSNGGCRLSQRLGAASPACLGPVLS